MVSNLDLWLHAGAFIIALVGLLISVVWHCVRDAERFGNLEGRVSAMERKESK